MSRPILNQARTLAEGEGWRVLDVVCRAGPGDPSFEEQHTRVSVTAVIGGSFVYRSSLGRAFLTPGALLLGNHKTCFECGHEHGAGDRCVSFQFTPELFETIAHDVPGVRSTSFSTNRIAPLSTLTRLFAAVEYGARFAPPAQLEETALRLAGAALALSSGEKPGISTATARDEARISQAVRTIEQNYAEALDLSRLAAHAQLSRYHFLRLFRTIVGATPYQYLMRTRFRAAARGLAERGASILDVALACGFRDLSEFTRGFRRSFDLTPSAYRSRCAGR
jgi:AraC-like DNA-binding protein